MRILSCFKRISKELLLIERKIVSFRKCREIHLCAEVLKVIALKTVQLWRIIIFKIVPQSKEVIIIKTISDCKQLPEIVFQITSLKIMVQIFLMLMRLRIKVLRSLAQKPLHNILILDYQWRNSMSSNNNNMQLNSLKWEELAKLDNLTRV